MECMVFWALYFGEIEKFRINISPPSSGPKSKLSKKQAEAAATQTSFLEPEV
jgi:hypothetical protein